MKRLIIVMSACVIVMACLCSCSKAPASLEKENSHNKHTAEVSKEKSEEEYEEKHDEILEEEPNKYIVIDRLVAVLDDVIIFKTHRDTRYGLMSMDGEIITTDISCLLKHNDNFEYCNNYIYSNEYFNANGNSVYSSEIEGVIDKQGNVVFRCREDNVTSIEKITQDKCIVWQKAEEDSSGETKNVICYSMKDMSEVFRYTYKKTNSRFRFYDSDGNKYVDIYDVLEAEGIGEENSSYWDGDDWAGWDWWVHLYEEYDKTPSDARKYAVGTTENTIGEIATLYMSNASEMYATMDNNGNVLMAATTDIVPSYVDTFERTVLYTFSHDLCCAFSTEEQKWGYIDPYGNWEIEPLYDSVSTFSSSGYAVVDGYKVIDTQGEMVFELSDTQSLRGTFSFEDRNNHGGEWITHTITFYADGTLIHKRNGKKTKGNYQLTGDQISFNAGWVDGDSYRNEVNYSIRLDGKNLYINSIIEWEYQQ